MVDHSPKSSMQYLNLPLKLHTVYTAMGVEPAVQGAQHHWWPASMAYLPEACSMHIPCGAPKREGTPEHSTIQWQMGCSFDS